MTSLQLSTFTNEPRKELVLGIAKPIEIREIRETYDHKNSFLKGGLNKKEMQLNLCNIFSISISI